MIKKQNGRHERVLLDHWVMEDEVSKQPAIALEKMMLEKFCTKYASKEEEQALKSSAQEK